MDSSSYVTGVTVTNPILEITPPGFDCPVVFTVETNFNKTFNSATLKIAPTLSYADLVPLPDGAYQIKYSVNPNLKVFVEYTLFRNCRLSKQFTAAVCRLFANRAKVTKAVFENMRKDLIWIKELIDASKYSAEECNDTTQAISLYNEALRLLLKYNNSSKC